MVHRALMQFLQALEMVVAGILQPVNAIALPEAHQHKCGAHQ